jgi:20S proteasome alpha/beta subunit
MSRFASQAPAVALYSPPQFNKRLPRQEPRPQQGKSMTIAAGFQCADGVLLVADSRVAHTCRR